MKPIEIEALTVRYGRRTALDQVSFAVAEGSVYALLGRNGSGKSSLVRCLLGGQLPASGRAALFGRDAWRERATLLAEVGVVPEEPDVPPAMSAREVERFFSRLYRSWDGAGMRERLRRFEVPLDVPFGRLSKGQKGQVSFSAALASVPRLLILDDPTLGLDAVARKAVFDELIGELADRGTTVFLTTHDLAEVERIADRVAVLRGGRLVLDEELETLKSRFRRLGFPGQEPSAGLAAFSPIAVESRAWGLEAVVADFDEARFARVFGPAGAAASGESAVPDVGTLTLEEIFIAVSAETARGSETSERSATSAPKSEAGR